MRNFYVVELAPLDEDGNPVPMLIGSEDWTTSPTDVPPLTPVPGYLENPGFIEQELFVDAWVTGEADSSFGSMVFLNPEKVLDGAGKFDHWWDLAFKGTKVTLRMGALDAAYPSQFVTVFVGYAGTPSIDDAVTLPIGDGSWALDSPVVAEGFAGSGGLEGFGSVPKPKQLVFGDAGFIPVVLIDANKGIYAVQFTGTAQHNTWLNQPSEEINPFYLWEGGVPIQRSTDYSSSAEMLSVEPDVGECRFWFGTDSSVVPGWKNGPVYVRVHGVPQGDLRVYAIGTPNDSDHARRQSAVGSFLFEHLALRAGIPKERISDAQAALGSALVDDVGVTFRELLSKASLATMAWWHFTRQDKFRSGYLCDPEDDGYYYGVPADAFGGSAQPLQPTTSLHTITPEDYLTIKRDPVPGMESPIWQLMVKARKAYPCNVLEGATATMRDYLTREWWATFPGYSDVAKMKNPGAISWNVEIENSDFPNSFSRRLFLERWFVLYGGRRDFFTITLKLREKWLNVELHNVITLQSPRYQMDAGRKLRVIGMRVDGGSETITMKLWGGAIGDFTGEVSLVPNTPATGTQPQPLLTGRRVFDAFQRFAYGAIQSGGAGAVVRQFDAFSRFTSVAVSDDDPLFGDVKLLLHGNGSNGSTTITDSSASPVTPTCVGNAAISTAQSKWGGASIAFDGTGDYIEFVTPSKLQIGTGDFTIEGWVRLTSLGSFRNFVQLNESGAQGAFAVRVSNVNRLQIIEIGGSGLDLGTNVTFSASVWIHWAVTRSGTTVRGFIDGTLLGSSQTISSNLVKSTSEKSFIGGDSFLMNGHLNDIRITVGAARYTSSFTPPAAAFPDS